MGRALDNPGTRVCLSSRSLRILAGKTNQLQSTPIARFDMSKEF